MEHRGGAVRVEREEGICFVIREGEPDLQGGQAQFHGVQGQFVQHQFSIQREHQAGGIRQGKGEGEGLVREHPIHGVRYLHLQIGEILRCEGALLEEPQHDPTAVLQAGAIACFDFIPLPGAGVHQGFTVDIRTHEVTKRTTLFVYN